MFYKLPIRSERIFSARHPSRIRTVSSGTNSLDRDGKKCWHLETYSGERFTITIDCLTIAARGLPDLCGADIHDIAQTNYRDMTDGEYGAWSKEIYAIRMAAARRAGVTHLPPLERN